MKNNFEHILLLEAPETKQTINLEAQSYSIGRHSSNSIKLHSQHVSRHHASLIRKELTNNKSSYILIDGDLNGNRSQNGIIVNGHKRLTHELKHGDTIIFGSNVKATYQIRMIAEEDEHSHPQEFEHREGNLNQPYKYRYDPTTDQLRNTLIISEKNLIDKLKNTDLNRLASFPELSPNPIIEIDFSGNITYTNPAASLKFANINLLKLEHPIISGLVIEEQQDRQGKLLTREVKIDERIYEQYIHYLSEEHLIRSYIFDITERKQSEDMLRYQALHDSLTGLPNREFFSQKLSQSIAKSQKINQQLAVLFIDLDRFKNINDTLSHSTGDKLLEGFAHRLVYSLKEDDILARWGGDEFTLILPEIENIAYAGEVAKIIMNSLKEPFYIEQHKIYVSSSIGVAVYPQDAEDEETLIKNADAALYRAKQLGRNNCQFYSPQINIEYSLLFKLENSLHHALENNEFSLNYQPQMNLKTNKIHCFEALIRWEHSELGRISPAKFIPLAEETGLIIPIGEWVLETACRQNKAWQNAGLSGLTVAVNLSGRQFQQENLAVKIADILQKTQLEPNCLELEITESILIQNVEFAQKTINELLELGVRISLDDFGTGYSSLAYLKKFPFHTMKIDKSFVQDITNNSQDMALISAVIAIGRSFNMTVVAEGVETKEQLELLQNLECETIQGYWLSHPLKEEDVLQFLSQHERDVDN